VEYDEGFHIVGQPPDPVVFQDAETSVEHAPFQRNGQTIARRRPRRVFAQIL